MSSLMISTLGYRFGRGHRKTAPIGLEGRDRIKPLCEFPMCEKTDE